jgi:hypothetical protein
MQSWLINEKQDIGGVCILMDKANFEDSTLFKGLHNRIKQVP